MADDLVWPRIVRPATPLVYLDLNHYINLAKAHSSDPADAGPYGALLESAGRAHRDGRAIFPLSGEHLVEMWEIADPRQRQDIAKVMEELSGFTYLMGRPELAELEIHAGVRARRNVLIDDLPLPLLGSSFAWAFGRVGGLQIVDGDGNDVSGATRREMGSDNYDAYMAWANLTAEREMLRGPSDEEIPELRANGFAPERARAAWRSRLAFEESLSGKLAAEPRWRRGRLRDLVSAREITHEWLEMFNRVNAAAGGYARVAPEAAPAVFAAAPHIQVAVSLKTLMHRDQEYQWTMNDIADVDAISVAYAYCDAVFTDKAVRHRLDTAIELRQIPTFLPRRPRDLAEWLDDLPTPTLGGLLVPVRRYQS